jgi:2-polyprenyl-3-methyl-5-hydroxy-6-metoxy-1,4-benzoquinol methylase
MEDIATREELFCLKYELDSLAEITLKNESERMLPNFCSEIIEHDHRERYKLVCQYATGLNVLDIACGVGYGSNMIAREGKAKTVLGCDLSQDAVRYARHRNKFDNLDFKVENAEQYLKENTYDLIVSFETIEHIPNSHKFLENAHKNLVAGGTFIVSTPISQLALDTNPSNPYHTQEWGFAEFQKEVSQFFDIQKIYVQLYQHAFINEKITKEFQRRKLSLKAKLKNNIKSKLRGVSYGPSLLTNWYDRQNFSRIEEYTGQYNAQDLGTKYIGYQILICNKK